MRIVKMYSHLNGHEHILVYKPYIWQEIEDTIQEIDVEKYLTAISKVNYSSDQLSYNPVGIDHAFHEQFRQRGWLESHTAYWVIDDHQLIRKTLSLSPDEQRREILDAGRELIYSKSHTDFVKDRIAVEVQFGEYAYVAYFDLIAKHISLYLGDIIDVGIEILPMKEFQVQMSSGMPFYEGGLNDLIRQGRGIPVVPAVPLVLIGIAP